MTTHLFRCLLAVVLMGVIGACDGSQPPGAATRAEEEAPAAGSSDAVMSTVDESAEESVEESAEESAEGTGEDAAVADETEVVEADEPPAHPTARERFDTEAILDQMRHDIWWNEPVAIRTLDLTEDQREIMDMALVQHMEGTMARMQRTPTLMEQYRAAVNERRWEEADALVDEMARLAGDNMAAGFVLQTTVLRELDESQWSKALEAYPGIVARPWVRGRRAMGAAQISQDWQRNRGRGQGAMGEQMDSMREKRRRQREERDENGDAEG